MFVQKYNTIGHLEKKLKFNNFWQNEANILWNKIKVGQKISGKEVIQKTSNLIVLELKNGRKISYSYSDFLVMYVKRGVKK
jgi:hypothetical protein